MGRIPLIQLSASSKSISESPPSRSSPDICKTIKRRPAPVRQFLSPSLLYVPVNMRLEQHGERPSSKDPSAVPSPPLAFGRSQSEHLGNGKRVHSLSGRQIRNAA